MPVPIIHRMRRYFPNLIMIALLAVFAVFLIYPIWLTVAGGFKGKNGGVTLYHILSIFRDPSLRDGLVHSFVIAVGTTLLCLIIALPLAVLSVKFDFPGKRIFSALILVPMILPPFVGAIGLSHLLG